MSLRLPQGSRLRGVVAVSDSRSALFVDRDGVLIVDADYISDPSLVELIPGSAAALARARDAGLLLVCLTNQSGIGRGYYSESDFFAVQDRVDELLLREGVALDLVCYCPHSPEEGCSCRKPGTGLLDEAAGLFRWEPAASAMVGDKLSDVDLALNAGLKPLLVLTGKGRDESESIGGRVGVEVVPDLAAAVDVLLSGEG